MHGLFSQFPRLAARREGKGKEKGHAPDQDLAQVAGELLVDELLGVGQLDVHVAVGADEAPVVLGFAPLQAHDDVLVDAACGVSIA